MALAVDLVQVATTARRWDDQNLCLRTVHEALSVPATGFTPRVQAEAQAFLTSWVSVTGQLLVACEAHADGLRKAAREIVATDAALADGLARWVADVLLREAR